jgi:hypothetical protein
MQRDSQTEKSNGSKDETEDHRHKSEQVLAVCWISVPQGRKFHDYDGPGLASPITHMNARIDTTTPPINKRPIWKTLKL